VELEAISTDNRPSAVEVASLEATQVVVVEVEAVTTEAMVEV